MKPIEQISKSMRPPATALLIALTGLVVMVSIMALTGDPIFTRDAAALCTTAFVGAGMAGFATFWCFGHERGLGIVYAILGGIGATLLGAFLAGLLFFGLVEQAFADILAGSLVASLFIASMIVTSPVAIAWVLGMLGTHAAARYLRRCA